jgi:class 3 adenylate cyclase
LVHEKVSKILARLPDGTITFLYTDIEGSTPLWDQKPRAMSISQELHNRLLHKTISDHQGQVFKVIGDAFQAVFISPVQAIEAAVALQRDLPGVDWGETGQVRVRIGIHVGTVKSEGNDYISSNTQNRVARIMSAGHGGQILLSLAVAELVRGILPGDVDLLDLGEHYLKGLSQPEHIFQVTAPGLQEKFPAAQHPHRAARLYPPRADRSRQLRCGLPRHAAGCRA